METKEQHPLLKVKWGVIPIVNYKNCLIEKIIGGYKIFGQKMSTEKEVDEAITKSEQAIQNSIK